MIQLSDIGGVWRTVGGRKIFIKDGEDLATAMRNSGKFKTKTYGLGANSNNTYENHPKPVKLGKIKNIDDIEKTLKYYEKTIKDVKIENAIVITTDGTIYQCFGNENNVWPDKDLGDKLKGASITHNHLESRTNNSFSHADVNLFQQYELARLRGIDNKYTYELNRNDKPSLKIPSWEDDVEDNSMYHMHCIQYAIDNDISYKRWKND